MTGPIKLNGPTTGGSAVVSIGFAADRAWQRLRLAILERLQRASPEVSAKIRGLSDALIALLENERAGR
jgi:hypothetical protein